MLLPWLASVAAGSEATLNSAGVLIGSDIVAVGTTLGVAGRLAAGIEGITAIAGAASVRQVGSQIIVDFLPANFLYRDAAERFVDGPMDYLNVPNKPGCVIQ